MMSLKIEVSCFDKHVKHLKLSYLARFKVDFGPVQQVQFINNSNEDRSEVLIPSHIERKEQKV